MDDLHPRAADGRGDGTGDVSVFAGKEPVGAVEKRHLGAETGEHAGELQTDEAGPDHDQPPGEWIDVLQRCRVVDVGSFDSGQVRAGGHGAGVDHHSAAGDT